MSFFHRHERRLDAWFEGRLAPRHRAALRRDLRACEGCREHFGRLALAQRALEGKAADELSLLERELVEELVLPPAPRVRRVVGWVSVSAVVAAAALVLVPGHDGELVAKGSEARGVALRPICVERAGDDLRAREASEGCPVGSYLKVAYAGPAAIEHLTLVVVDDAGRRLWTSAVARPAPGQVVPRYAVLEHPGQVVLYGIASKAPLDDSALAEVLSRPIGGQQADEDVRWSRVALEVGP